MNSIPLFKLISDITGDLRDSTLMWQLGTILACIVAGWTLAQLVRRAFAGPDVQASMARLGGARFAGVLAPLLIVLLLAMARQIIGRYLHVNLIRVAIPIVGSLAGIRFAFYLVRRVFARRGHAGAGLLMFEKIFAIVAWVCVALYIAGLWPDLFQFLDDTTVPLGRSKMSLTSIGQACVSVVVLLVLALWAGAALEERLMKVDGLHASLRVVLARTARALLIVVAVLVSLSMVGIDLTVLSVFGGALGVGLGLGLQKIASNYVSGFVILLDRSLTIGDMISVDKYSGRVTQINTRYTVLQGLDGTESVLPNEMLVSGPVQNFSLTNSQVCLTTHVTVSYDSDLEAVLALMETAAAGVPRVVPDRPPAATLLKFGPDGLELELGFWIGDPENGRGGVLSDVNRAIWRVFQEQHIGIPSPQREVRLINPAPPNHSDNQQN